MNFDAAEVTLHANSPNEAAALAEITVKQKSILQKLHRTLESITLNVPSQSNEKIDVKLESLPG